MHSPSVMLRPSPTHSVGSEFWVPVLTNGQKMLFRASLVPYVVVSLAFIAWWLLPWHHTDNLNSLVATFLCSFELIIPAYFYFFASRMKRVNQGLEPSLHWRVAMVVTKAPTEPWEMVKETLVAMLRQDVSHDTWLADEDPAEETIAWCKVHHVQISTRKNQTEYHRPTWPQRARCKEGNLAYFYDMYGYDRYDLVAQLDADHAPDPNYLREILRPFHDPAIGYVAAPSICDNNRSSSWAARGRLFAEATLHGALQAGYNEQWAPLCIGSHYAVRTRALQEIGGLGPELAEDHSTSLMMNAHGWRGAFQIDAIAHGDGPATFADCMIQEYQWSRSLTMILFQWTPKFWNGLSLSHKAQFLFSQLWYPLFSSVALIGFLVPISCLLFDKPLVNINYFTFMAFVTLLAVANTLPALFLKRFGCMRPHDARLISWEEPLFTITRFPWILGGIINGIFTVITGRQLTFRVTPKGSKSSVRLRTLTIAPYVFLSASISFVAIFAANVKSAAGYYYLSLLAGGIITLAMLSVIYLHHKETDTRRRKSKWSISAALATTGLLLIASALRLQPGLTAIMGSKPSQSRQASVVEPASHSMVPHVSRGGQAGGHAPIECNPQPCFGVHDEAGTFSGIRDGIQIDHSFIPWGSRYADRLSASLTRSCQLGRMPLITLEFWPWAVINLAGIDHNGYKKMDNSFLRDIAAGKYDDSLTASLKVIGGGGSGTVYVRIMHEMEFTKQYPWFTENPAEFVLAYRHVVGLSQRLGIRNIAWVWSPAGLETAHAYWPGHAYVDYVGLSIYAHPQWNWDHAPLGQILSMETLLGWKYWVNRFGKPVILAEVGVNGSPDVKRNWIKQASMSLSRFPAVVAWVYFNQSQPPLIPLDIGLPDWSLSRQDALDVTRNVQARQ